MRPPTRTAPAAAVTQPTDLIAAADELLGVMGTIRRSGRRRFGRPEEFTMLTGSQLELVRLVRRRPGVSVTDAADELGLAQNTVSTLVRQLSELGLLLRSADPGDRRVARLDLATQMRRKADAFRDRRVLALAAALDRLPARDRRSVVSAVESLATLADEYARGEPLAAGPPP